MNFDGILNINKPAGMSSFKCMSIVKKKLGLNKVGFLGTLDPLASGVLVLLCGKYTKLADKLHEDDKVYQSVFTFGIETDTLDCAGTVIARNEAIPSKEQIENVLPSMVGDIEIEVPRYSAVHINGQRAYDLARKGVEFTAPKRVVTVKRFELLPETHPVTPLACHPSTLEGNTNSNFRKSANQISKETSGQFPSNVEGCRAGRGGVCFEIECSAGTYIRSLAKLLAQKLGTVAIASTIIRTRVGQFDIKDSKHLENIAINDIITL